MSTRYLREDALASEIARLLRLWPDLDYAETWLAEHYGHNAIIALAFQYERARRRAFPSHSDRQSGRPSPTAVAGRVPPSHPHAAGALSQEVNANAA